MESPTSVRVERRFELVENRSRDMLRNVPRRAHLDKLDAARDERFNLKLSRSDSALYPRYGPHARNRQIVKGRSLSVDHR